ncbi:hypothetical protein RM572_16430 [Streptomyces sp. DSM 42041]|uniref:Tryptophan-rich sensory protein n=1 Tax=Streptomyces hazeniae TaxID=3075538 RepID=A0ABU2NWH6_9ACTN|nr:hypothetical protein [Streptomyces sp. DSM 42041]MDT0380342.1 hypothetical protein [Streptomyces sp. DSM 42041]
MSRTDVGRIAGAAATGAVVGWTAAALWAHGVRRGEAACSDSPGFCLSLYPLGTFAAWIALALVVFGLGLRRAGVRPLWVTVPVCTLLVWWTTAYFATVSGDVPHAGLAALFGAPAAALVCAAPPERSRMRVAWPVGVAALLLPALARVSGAV